MAQRPAAPTLSATPDPRAVRIDFAVPNGEIHAAVHLYDAGGALQMSGELGFCIDCHEANGLERTDWVQGVPMDAR